VCKLRGIRRCFVVETERLLYSVGFVWNERDLTGVRDLMGAVPLGLPVGCFPKRPSNSLCHSRSAAARAAEARAHAMLVNATTTAAAAATDGRCCHGHCHRRVSVYSLLASGAMLPALFRGLGVSITTQNKTTTLNLTV
jgi:hypothetical protein